MQSYFLGGQIMIGQGQGFKLGEGRFRLRSSQEIALCEGGEVLAEAAPSLGVSKARLQPSGIVEGVLAHNRRQTKIFKAPSQLNHAVVLPLWVEVAQGCCQRMGGLCS